MKLRLLISCLLAVGITTACAGVPMFNPGNGNYYEAVSTRLPWTSARDDAATRTHLGILGHLVTITSASENDFVYNSVYLTTFTASSSTTRADWVWLGGFQLPGSVEPLGGWSWITGEPFSFSNWDPGQPSDTAGNPGGYHQDLLVMWSGATWNDVTGDGGLGYIVEYEVVPEPSTFCLLVVGTAVLAVSRCKPRSWILGGGFITCSDKFPIPTTYLRLRS